MTVAAGLLNVPHDQPSWDIWAFDLDQNIRDLQQAIGTQRNIRLAPQQLYPVPPQAMQEWLSRVSDALGEIVAILRLPAADVENVNLEDPRERQSWANQVFSEVRDARAALKI